MIDKESELPVTRQCELLKVNRASVYYQPAPVPAEDLKIMRAMDEIHLLRPFLGSHRLVDEQQGKGFEVYHYLLDGLVIDHPNHVWAADITYLPMARGFAYLVGIIDVYSRRLLAWRLSNSMDARFCLGALEEALERYGRPEIFMSSEG